MDQETQMNQNSTVVNLSPVLQTEGVSAGFCSFHMIDSPRLSSTEKTTLGFYLVS